MDVRYSGHRKRQAVGSNPVPMCVQVFSWNFSGFGGRKVASAAPAYITNCASSQAVHDLYNRIVQIHQNQQLLEQQKQQHQKQQQL